MSHYPNRHGYPPAGPPPGRLPQRPPPHHHHGMPPPPPGFIPGYLPPPPPGMHGPPPGMHAHAHPHAHPPPHMPPRSNSGGGYRMTPPPPPHAGYRGPPGPPGASYYGGGSARSGPPQPPSAPAAAHVPGFTHDELDRMSRVFVGNISSGVDDAWMDRILGACGPIKEWKRMRNPDGSPKGFGFVTFADPDAVVRALDVIGGEAMPGKQPIELPSMDRTPWKRLLIKLDESARKLLDRYRATRGVRPNDANIDGHARARLFEILDNLRGVAPPPPESRDVEKLVPTPEPTAAAILPTPAPPGLPSLDDMAVVSTKLRDTPSGSVTPRPMLRTPSMQSLPPSDATTATPPPSQPVPPRRSRWDLGNSSSKSPAPKPATPTAARAPAPKPRATFVEVEEGEVPAAASTGPAPLLKLKSKGFLIKKPGTTLGGGSSNGRSSPAPGSTARVSFDADGDADEHLAKRTRLIPLKRAAAAPAESVDEVLGASIKWENWTSEAKEQVQAAVLRAVNAFLGADDDDLSEYIVMTVDARTSAQDLVVDLGDVFADDTKLFVASVWKTVMDATS
ncbi:hypothetical protein AMAG_05293 [Allomyces macrogynus ATCC 38327]|uniref:RRM domain-containing protein n=1 Tax=Allomyces macrogynus (strain ATCC 38327) TaxID=578462 RepID=A0A0L0SBP3_ALLM3|nr:hypothetical protein AMAG_05293 [Allomyces macrogynus ATCC 38327]|eukprot:KNE59839.1 hypothetical protein AMAG_05293 [Allomyces macrogynus ATCC 38327]